MFNLPVFWVIGEILWLIWYGFLKWRIFLKGMVGNVDGSRDDGSIGFGSSKQDGEVGDLNEFGNFWLNTGMELWLVKCKDWVCTLEF